MRLIDLHHAGLTQAVGAWQVDDVLIDCGPASCLDLLVAELGDWRPRALLLTHIHLDHAGATGALVRKWPDLEVFVHERGALHLASPERLLASASRIYGDLMETLWGDVIRVPVERLRSLQGGEQVGSFTVAYTPGHASHHISFLHESGRAFVGDVAGVRVLPQTLIMPHAPPPDIDLEAWESSLGLIRDWAPASLALPQFGVVDDVQAHLEQVRIRLTDTAGMARDRTEDEFVHDAEQRFAQLPAPFNSIYRATAPPADSYAGLRRYWTKAVDAVQADRARGNQQKR